MSFGKKTWLNKSKKVDSTITKKFSIQQLLLFILEPTDILIGLDRPLHKEQLINKPST